MWQIFTLNYKYVGSDVKTDHEKIQLYVGRHQMWFVPDCSSTGDPQVHPGNVKVVYSC